MNAWRMDARLTGVRTAGTFNLKLELDQRERRIVSRCLLTCRSPLIETIGDTTRSPASRRIASRELELVESVLRKLECILRSKHDDRGNTSFVHEPSEISASPEEGARLIGAFVHIKQPELRATIIKLVTQIADEALTIPVQN